MTVLKGLALGLLGFLLFLSLTIFGLAYMLNKTLLEPDFITSELDRLEVSTLIGEFVSIETSPDTPYLTEAIDEAIVYLEPVVKEQISVIIYSVYDYLLVESQSLNLELILKDTVFNADFATSVVDEADIPSLAVAFLSEPLTGQIPPEMSYLSENLNEYLYDAFTKAEPALKEQLAIVADPFFAYLLGESQSLDAAISLEPVAKSLTDTLRERFLESPPPELASFPRDTLTQYFDRYFGEILAEVIPATFELDESVVGSEVPSNLAEALADAEEVLVEVKQYVGYFQLIYWGLIVFMALMVLGIILISRQVGDIARRLGIPLLIYGAFEYAGIWAARYFARTEYLLPGIPESFQTWMTQFASNILAPLEIFSLSLLAAGIVLTVVSFVYKPR